MTSSVPWLDRAGGANDEAVDDFAPLRRQVRAFLAEQRQEGAYTAVPDSWLNGADPAFSRRLAERGWVGMTLPVAYGGHGRSPLERFAVVEELLAAGAPVAAHWIADRQMGPGILRWGSEEQKRRYLPAIARGECFFAIGMSEPDAGSDLAAVRTRARRVDAGWQVTGTKLWTSGAHFAHAMVALVRTGDGERHDGLSQLVIDLPHPDIEIRPIVSLDGAHHFNEVVFRDAVVPTDALLGQEGNGWTQVTAELAHERSGPERVLSTMPLLIAWSRLLREQQDDAAVRELGRLTARAWVLRRLSLSVAAALARGESPNVAAALVKDLGTRFEGDVVDSVRRLARAEPRRSGGGGFERLLANSVLHVPGFTLRGGTNEVLRSVVARGLGVR